MQRFAVVNARAFTQGRSIDAMGEGVARLGTRTTVIWASLDIHETNLIISVHEDILILHVFSSPRSLPCSLMQKTPP
jgi:hypothetical protein